MVKSTVEISTKMKLAGVSKCPQYSQPLCVSLHIKSEVRGYVNNAPHPPPNKRGPWPDTAVHIYNPSTLLASICKFLSKIQAKKICP